MVNLSNLNNTLQLQSEQEARRLLEREGRRLKYIAVKIWRQYLSSYKPKEYARTRNSQRGIKLGRVHRLDHNTFGIELTFENDLMYHDSVVPYSSKKGHSIMLISDGWHSKKLEKSYGKKVYRHTYFEGIDYIGQVKKAFNSGKPVTVQLDVEWSGAYYKG